MSGQDANSKDMLSRIHEQRVKDQNNDSTQTGAFPMVKAKKRLCDPDKQHDIHL